jgi:hypothetical protein
MVQGPPPFACLRQGKDIKGRGSLFPLWKRGIEGDFDFEEKLKCTNSYF